MKKTSQLREHLSAIGRLGGEARAAKLTEAQRQKQARKAGKLGAAARNKKLTKAQRSEIARRAARSRWDRWRKQRRKILKSGQG
jgi:hypothetical protein